VGRDDLAVMTDDFSTICPGCGATMAPEHAHYRCRMCGYRDTCCDGAPAHACAAVAPAQQSLSRDGSATAAPAGRRI